MTLAAALTALKITWVDGVAGKNVLDKVLPGEPDSREGFTLGNKGSWRAHMNVLQRWVRHGRHQTLAASGGRVPDCSAGSFTKT
jgi:hypothetical protein